MATNVLIDFRQEYIQLMPIRQIALSRFVGEDEQVVSIHRLESGSVRPLTSRTKAHYRGGVTTVGYTLNPVIYISQNDYKSNNLIAALEQFVNQHDILAYLYLGTVYQDIVEGPSAEEPNPDVINATEGMRLRLQNASLSYSIESVEFRDRLVLNLYKEMKSPLVALNSEGDYELFDEQKLYFG